MNARTLLLTYRNRSPSEQKIEESFKYLGFNIKAVNLVSKSDSLNLDFNPQIIIHLAGSTDTSKIDHRSNNIGTKNLIESIKNLGKDTHIIFTSTTAVFAGRESCQESITEETKPNPSNAYGRSKLFAEKYLIKKCKQKKFRLTILRLSTVYGENTRDNGLFSILKKSIMNKGLISRVNWPGLTSLVHVKDVCDVIWEIANKPPFPGRPETFLVYSESFNLAGISKYMQSALGVELEEIRIPEYIWKLLKSFRKLVPSLEGLLLYTIYNMFWRLSLIVDDVLYCRSDKLRKRLPVWVPRRFSDGVRDVIA